MNKRTYNWAIIFLLLSACGKRPNASPLLIATAANMQFAMKDICLAFEEETGQACELIIGSSGKLTAQILEGAPYDVFVSADTKYPNSIYKQGKSTTIPQIYALGKIVIWSNSQKPLFPLDSLIQKDIKIAIANPTTAPYGRAAQEALKQSGLSEQAQDKLIYGESIAQVNRFVETQNVDFGITSISSVLSMELKGKGHWAAIPDSLYNDIEQSVIMIKQGEKSKQGSKVFEDFLFSKKAQAILKQYGYQLK